MIETDYEEEAIGIYIKLNNCGLKSFSAKAVFFFELLTASQKKGYNLIKLLEEIQKMEEEAKDDK